MTAADRLNEIEARANAATEGPWFVSDDAVWVDRGEGNADGITGPLAPWCFGEAEFIAHARTDVPALVAALRAVLDLHVATKGYLHDGAVCLECTSFGNPEISTFGDVEVPMPCATVRVIEEALS